MTTTLKTANRVSLKTQTLFGIAAAALAVILPHLCHSAGQLFGIGSALGEYLLPMHLPIMLSGILLGPVAGVISGFVSPLISFMLSGMPSASILPFMVIELTVYGLTAGLLKNINFGSVLKVLCVQASGRLVRAAAIIIAFYVFDSTAIPVSIIYTSLVSGVIGMIIQLIVIPAAVSKVKD